tara:strand:- start:171 stop:299 length:129 start_codon:yes stop_codon:yes gene_type:complete
MLFLAASQPPAAKFVQVPTMPGERRFDFVFAAKPTEGANSDA